MLGLGTSPGKQNYASFSTKYKSTKYLEFDGVSEYGELLESETFADAVGTTGGTMCFWVRSSEFYSPTNNQISYMMGQYYFVFPNVKSFYFGTKNDGGTNRLVIYRSDLNITTSTFTIWSDFKTTGPIILLTTLGIIAITMKPFAGSWRTCMWMGLPWVFSKIPPL